MKAKLQHLIKSEGLTASRFAEMLEIQPAGVSHILAGRNKPSFDLLQKILRRFPKINPDWLLLDSEQMYRDGWNENGSATDGTTSIDPFGAGGNFGTGSPTQNSGMPTGSLFGGANGGMNGSGSGQNFSGSQNFSGGANFGSGNPIQPNSGANGGNPGFSGCANNFGGANSGNHFGAQNLSRGESHISGGVGIPTHLSNPRTGQSIQKIVIFYADGTFEAYF